MTIRTSVERGIQVIGIDRPERKNALTIEMYQAIASAIGQAVADPSVRALLIHGLPGIFCSGNDIGDFLQRVDERPSEPVPPFMEAFLDCDKPIVAAVTGHAIGVGATMLLHCDLVYLAEDARIGMPFVSLGVVPEFASSVLLPRLMGTARAAEVLLLGEPLSAAEAVAAGLANAALPPDQVLPHARAAAERFLQLPPGATRDTKRLLRAGIRTATREAIAREMELFRPRLRSAEAKEAFQAFIEKRPPRFS
ncbi:MAG: enoyl-CoA hydratase [Gemmatimonadetes bacterium]|nr:enoyl-CoA hydratase [Gemmatimonadota bacterium]